MIEDKGLVSIIVPVYNAEKHISKCIESVISQTYSNWELILVNDGSRDNSHSVCKNFAQNDNRIKVLNKINGGASSARNAGIKVSQGKYICFIDSDDYVGNKYIEDLIVPYIQGSNTMIICGMTILNKNIKSYFTYDNYEIRNNLFENLSKTFFFQHGGPTSKLYLKSIIDNNNIRFDEKLCNYEDLIFNLSYIEHIDCIIYSNSTQYVYVTDNSNQSRKLNGIDNEIYLLNTYKTLLNRHKDQDISSMEDYINHYIYRIIKSIHLANMPISKSKEIEKELAKIVTLGFSYGESHLGKFVCYLLKNKEYFLIFLLMKFYKLIKA